MKIFQINCVYGRGSTGTLTRALHRGLTGLGEDSRVIYGRGEDTEEVGVSRLGSELYGKANGLRARLSGLMYGGCELSTGRLITLLRDERPDLVHLQCINGTFVNVYRLIDFLKREGIPTVITIHAEFLYTANCSHAYDCDKWKTGCGACPNPRVQTHSWLFDASAASWKRMAEAFDGFEKLSVVSVSPWQRERAEQSPFFRNARHRVILNGVDSVVFRSVPERERREHVRILHVSPHFDPSPGHIKGGEYVLRLAERLGDRAEIQIVGPAEPCRAPENVKLLGAIWQPKELAKLYSQADLTLLTSRRETFSMVCVESLCCGTPVVGFAAGGPESIALREYSSFVPFGDEDALYKAVLTPPPGTAERISRAAAERYGLERMIEEYLDEYRKVRT